VERLTVFEFQKQNYFSWMWVKISVLEGSRR